MPSAVGAGLAAARVAVMLPPAPEARVKFMRTVAVADLLAARARVLTALDELRAGRVVILTDDEDRENEGDFVCAAQHAVPEVINFMAVHGRGLICLTITGEQAHRLRLAPMVRDNRSRFHTAFTESIEAACGVTTGISAHDRSHTVRLAAAPGANPDDLVRPGHVFPIVARDGGTLVRPGQTEGSVDLARLAGLTPAGVICEVIRPDGTMARRPDLERVAAEHGLHMLSVADIIAHRSLIEPLVRPLGAAAVQTAAGAFDLHVFAGRFEHRLRFAFVREPADGDHTPVHVVRGNASRDLLGLGPQNDGLAAALAAVGDRGVVVYSAPADDDSALLRGIPGFTLPGDDPVMLAAAGKRIHHAGFETGESARLLQNLGVRSARVYGLPAEAVEALSLWGLPATPGWTRP